MTRIKDLIQCIQVVGIFTTRFVHGATWQTLVQSDPNVAGLLTYCNAIDLKSFGCAEKFLGKTQAPAGLEIKLGATTDFTGSAVALQAAGICIEKQELQASRLSKLYNIDVNQMRERASGIVPYTPTPGWQKTSGGEVYRLTYSDEQRENAARVGRQSVQDQYTADMRTKSATENALTKTFKEHPENWAVVSEIILRQTYEVGWGVGQDAANAAYNSPGSIGLREDLVCYAGSDSCRMLSTGAEVDIPEGSGANNYIGDLAGFTPPTNDIPELNEMEKSSQEKSGKDVKPPEIKPPTDNDSNNGNHGSNGDDDPFEASFDDADMNPIINDDINATPVLEDLNMKTALQQCQEKEEKNLWDEIAVSDKDPNVQTDEEKKDNAEMRLRFGACDRAYYSEDFCRKWKFERDAEQIPPSEQQQLDEQRETNPFCPINLITPEGCAKITERLHKQFLWSKPLADAFNAGWASPSPPAGFRIDLTGPLSTSPRRLNALSFKDWMGDDWKLAGIAPSRPRIANGASPAVIQSIQKLNLQFKDGTKPLSPWILQNGEHPHILNPLDHSDWMPNIPVAGQRPPGRDGIPLGSQWRPRPRLVEGNDIPVHIEL